jgi:hypothetical protein
MMDGNREPGAAEYALDTLKQELMTWETENLRAIKAKALEIAESLRGKEGSRDEITRVRDLYQQVAQEYSNDNTVQLGIMFASALVLKEYGAEGEFLREIDDAIEFAYVMGLGKYAKLLETLL